MPPHRLGFLRRFGLKTGIDFEHFGLELGRLFEGPTGVYDCACHFNSKKILRNFLMAFKST